jgi:hypothetical protein
MIRRLAALTAVLLFGSIDSASAQPRSYPSLSRRAVEGRDRDAEIARTVAQAPVVKPLSDSVVNRLTRLGTQAATGGAAFDRSMPACDAAVAAAGRAAVASESWVVAQQAVSALDTDRFDSVAALAGMDSIYVEQLNDGGDAAAVESYRAPVLAMVDRQNDRLDALRVRLTSP